MQLTFDLEAEPLLSRIRDQLLAFYGPQQPVRRMEPLSQLIKSVISSRTYDAVSWVAFLRLREAFPEWAVLATTPPKDIEAILAPVTHADAKARQLPVLIRVLQTRPGAGSQLPRRAHGRCGAGIRNADVADPL